MALTFRKLEVFVAVAEDGNFRRAADRLGISQPSVSSQIKSMERYLGYALFERRRGATSVLSAEGRAFLTRARSLVDAQSALAAERHPLRRPAALHLKVCVGPLLLERCIKPAMAVFQEQHPDIVLEFLSLDPASDGAAAVRRGDLDVLLCTGAKADRNDHVDTEVLARIKCSIYGVPMLVRPVLQGAVALNSVPFLLPPDHLRITQWTMEQFRRHDVHPAHLAARPASLEAMLQMLLAGKGLGLFFDAEIASHLRAGRVLSCGPEFEPAARSMLTGRRARSPEVAPLLDLLRRIVRLDAAVAVQQDILSSRNNHSSGAERMARLAGL